MKDIAFFLDDLIDPFWVFDVGQNKYIYINEATYRLYGVSRELVEKQPYFWLDCVLAEHRAEVKEMSERVKQDKKLSLTYQIVNRRNERRWIIDQKYYSEREGHCFIYGNIKDITIQKEKELGTLELNKTLKVRNEELKATQTALSHNLQKTVELAEELNEIKERYQRAEEIGMMGNWEFDVVNDRLTWSENLFSLFEVKKSKFKGDSAFYRSLVHPEDFPKFAEEERKALQREGLARFEHRIITPMGKEKHVALTSVIEKDETNAPIRFYGTVRDVTELKQIQEKLKLKEAKLQAISFLQAHGFRRPITNILGLIELLNSDEWTAEENRLVFAKIKYAAEELDTMLAEFLASR